MKTTLCNSGLPCLNKVLLLLKSVNILDREMLLVLKR